MIANKPSWLLLCLLICVVSPVFGQRNLKDIPEPNPEAEIAAMRVDPAAEVNLFASDPQIRKPIQSNFDSLGRLWVASSEAYPQLAPGQIANDKIVVLADEDGDGVAEKSTVFAEGLLMPTGVIPDGVNAAYVAHATELLHLRDTDGDGKADQRRVVLSGFGTEDTHHLIHTLRWGPDGCLYFNQSIYIHSTVETAYGVERLDGGGIWRFRPETGKLEVLCKGFVNPWGHVFDAYGQSLVTDGAYFEGINHAFPDAVFVTSPGAPRWLRGMNPGSPKHCGLAMLSGTHVPEGWQGELVTNDFRSHRVCRFNLQRNGSTFAARQQPEVITSSHIAFRPIDAAMGGDGALYIADWYNPIIQHGEVDFRDPRRDREHGRIWRVSFPGRPLAKVPDYANLEIDALVGLLEDPALTVRQFARLELKGRDAKAVRAATGRWVELAADPQQREHRSLEAMWIDECLNVVDPQRIAETFAADNERIRAAAVRSIGIRRSELAEADAYLAKAVTDPSGLVRLEAVAALGRGDRSQDVELALGVLDQGPLDDHLDFALWTAVRNLLPNWAPALAQGDFDFGGRVERLVFLLSAAGNPEAAAPIVAAVTGASDVLSLNDDQAAALVGPLAGIASGPQLESLVRTILGGRDWNATGRAQLMEQVLAQTGRRGVQLPGLEPALVAALKSQPGPEMSDALLKAGGQWKLAGMVPVILETLGATDAGSPLAARMVETLGAVGSGEAIERLVAMTRSSEQPAGLRVEAAVALLGPARPQSLAAVKMLLGEPSTSAAMIGRCDAILSRKGMFEPFAKLISEVELTPDNARALVAEVRSVGAPDGVVEAVRRAGKLDEASWKWSDSLRDEILAMASTSGDPARGEQIYRHEALQCIQCHAIGEAGGLVGPNLVSLGGAATPEYILRSLIEPNDKLKEGFATTKVLTIDGRVLQGIPAGGDDETLQLRTADGSVVTIARNEIEAQSAGQSLMPAGLVDVLSKQQLADLTRFLGELGKTPAYTVGTRQLVRNFEALIYSPEANRRMNRTSNDAVVSGEPAFQWKPLTSLVSGHVPVAEIDSYQQHREVPPTGYVRFSADVGESGNLRLQFSTDEGLQMWVDGRPTPIDQAGSLELSPGTHQITLGIDKTIVTDGVSVEVLP